MKVLVTGGSGYKGHILVPHLLARGYEVEVLDTLWFGEFFTPHPKLTITKGDVLNLSGIDLSSKDIIIHLASIANDPCADLDPVLTWETSALATMQLADKAARAGVKQFIFASSGSVYGIKEEENVVETLELEPVSGYNKSKAVAERALLSYAGDMAIQIIRPATVCGLSPRMRLDVSVNLLTMAALTKGEITVFGGKQIRPNVHIEDIIKAYLHFIDNPDLVGIYNVGFENISILGIAEMITEYVPAKIKVTESSDIRSYRVNSDKLLSTGFVPEKSVKDAIQEIRDAFEAGVLKDERHFHNLRWMKEETLN